MVVIDFPSNPALNQEFVVAGNTYVFNGTGWTTGAITGTGTNVVLISDTPPTTPRPGDMWWESDTGALWIWYADADTAQWVQAAGSSAVFPDAGGGGGGAVDAYTKTESDARYVNVAGDVMTGNLGVEKSNPSVVLNKLSQSAEECAVTGTGRGFNRWKIILGNGTVEDGTTNVGSDFEIKRYADSGALLGTSFVINRSNGTAYFYNGLALNSASPTIVLNKTAAGQNNYIAGYTNNASRWTISLGNNTPESGSDAGSDFSLTAANDAGAGFPVLSILRATGNATFYGSVTALGGLAGKGAVNAIAAAGANAHFYLLDETGAAQGIVYWARSTDAIVVTNSSSTEVWSFNQGGQFTAGRGITTRDGTSNTPGGNWYNFKYETALLHAYMDVTWLGSINLTASDYRIKKDIVALPSMWDKVKALRPIKYTHTDYTPPAEETRTADRGGPFIAGDSVERWGFIAHELQATLTESAATGVKDQADAIQSLNLGIVVAALTKALQEAMAKIEAQDARIAALEGN